MPTCKDCFHWNACKKMLEAMWGHSVPSGYEGGADRCEDFISAADVVPRAEVGEHLEDLLTEFDEFGMQPTILVPDPEGMAIEWKRKLEYAIGLIKAETAREIIEDVATLIEAHWSEIQHGVYWLVCGRCTPLRELLKTVEKKYTEGEK